MANSTGRPKAVILEVDDDTDIRELVARVLQGEGYEVLLAADGSEALALLAARRPDLVLLDMKMPGKSGPEVLKEIRAMDESLPVMLVTGVTDMEAATAAIANGARGYLLKPFHRSELLRCLTEVLHPPPDPDNAPSDDPATPRAAAP